MKNSNNLLFVAVALLFFVIACSSTKVSSGNTSDSSPAPSQTASTIIKRFQINQNKKCGDINLTLGEIAVEPGKITAGMTISNQGKDEVSFYPDQKSLVIGKKQLDVNPFMGEGKLSGDFQPGIEKKGSLVYVDAENNLKPEDVGEIAFHFGDVISTKTFKNAPCDLNISLK